MARFTFGSATSKYKERPVGFGVEVALEEPERPKDRMMKRAAKNIDSKHQKTSVRDPRIVPLVVPHGGAEAGRDFETAFDVVRCDERVHQLWRRAAKGKLPQES